MKKILFLKGLPASGKSTFAKELIDKEPNVWKRVSKDDLRAMLDHGKWSGKNEKFIVGARNLLICGALEKEYSVISDDTNLNSSHEEFLRSIATKYDADFEIKDFTDVGVDECIRRD